MNKFAFFDLDGTLHDKQSCSAFLIYLENKKNINLSFQDEYQKYRKLYLNNKINNSEIVSFVLNFASKTFELFDKDKLEHLLEDFVKSEIRLYDWVFGTVKYLTDKNFSLNIISASFQEIIKEILKQNKIDIPNIYCSKIYGSGKIKILNENAKLRPIEKILKEKGLSVGFGDSHGDLPMLERMDIAFVINPLSKNFIKTAHEKAWIVTNDKNEIINTIDNYLKKNKY